MIEINLKPFSSDGKDHWAEVAVKGTLEELKQEFPYREFREIEDFGYVPGYPKPSESYDRNPFNLIEGNENKLY